MKNTGASRVLDFVKSKVMAAEMTLKDKIGDGIHGTGTPSTDIGGLRLIVDAGNTVGGIAQADYSWWQAQEDSTTTVLTIGDLQSQFNTLSMNGKTPTIGVATRANFNRIYNLLQPQQRFVDSQIAKAGFQSIMLNGVPVVISSKAGANHFFWLNEEFLHLYYHPRRNFVLDPFIKSSNQDAMTAKVFWMGNLGTSNAKMNGKFSGLTA